MARSPLDALVTEKTLSRISVARNAQIVDLIASGRIETSEPLPLKNVCAKVIPELADEIDEICGLLDISKRAFIEAAFLEAVSKARSIMKAEGLFEKLNQWEGE